MSRHRFFLLSLILAAAVAGTTTTASARDDADERTEFVVDSPFYTLQGPAAPMIALIQTDIEVEYIGDYLELDMDRAAGALRLLAHVDFAESMLLVVNGGPVAGAMLRVESIYEEAGELHVVVVTDDLPSQYRDSGFASPTSDTLTPSVVTVLPRYQGRIVVHAYPADWAFSGDLRGVQLVLYTSDQGERVPGNAADTEASPKRDE